MAPRQKLEEEGYTKFGGESRFNSWFNPSGRLARWWAAFSGSKAKPYVADQAKDGDTPMHPLGGDALVKDDVVKARGPAGTVGYDRNNEPYLPEQEIKRKQRYIEYEKMDDYPEIGAAFDIYADDCTQKDTRGRRWRVVSDSKLVIDEVEKLFRLIKLDRFYWDIVRNAVKYGDNFIELILDVENPTLGIQRIKILNPSLIVRVENEYGYLTDFLQEIPDKDDWEAFGGQADLMRSNKYITLDKNQIVHFRLHTSDPVYYPYGRSIAALAMRIYRSLKMMEDAMLIYRLARAPERRVFYIDIGNLPASKSEMFIEKVKRKFKKEKFYNPNRTAVDERFNPISQTEDFFVPVRGDRGTKIDTLQGAENLGEVDDVKYFRDKLLASLKIPKDYVVEKEQSPERKANLSQLDVKFARTVARIQKSVEVGLETIAKRHLQLKQFPAHLINEVRIELPDPSDMVTKRKLDIDEQKARVVQAIQQTDLFSNRHIYKEYFNLTDWEIEELKLQIKKEEASGELQKRSMGMIPGEVPLPGEEEEMMDNNPNPDQEAGGQEPNENIPPTSNEGLALLQGIKAKLLSEGLDDTTRFNAINRLIKKEEQKLKNLISEIREQN